MNDKSKSLISAAASKYNVVSQMDTLKAVLRKRKKDGPKAPKMGSIGGRSARKLMNDVAGDPSQFLSRKFVPHTGAAGPKGPQGSPSSMKTRRGWGDASDAEAHDQWMKDMLVEHGPKKKKRR
tara:strand:+ start:1083 stop:1451 length:369 start_codon:yes stop_codon:yes gene_type:complete